MNTTILRYTVLVVLLAGALCAVAVPATAQGDGEIDLVIEPTNTTVDPGETQTYNLVVEGPDNGILAFDDVFVELGDPGAANITGFTEQYNTSFNNSEIRDGGATLLLDAFVPDDFNSPAPSVTLANFTVAAEGSPGETTVLAFNQTAGPTVVDSDDNAYNITSFVNGSLSIPEPANFAVSIDSTNSPVVEGDTLSVTATIENTGDLSDSQTVGLSVSGLGSDSSSVSLNGGASTQETFSVGTSSGDVGDYTATVSSDDDSASTGVRVDAPANFGVSIDSTNSPVVEGDTLSVTATIENTGNVSGTQTVQLGVGSLGSDSSSVTLVGGASTQETFSVGTSSGDVGDYTATVSTDDDSASTGVRVDAPANFAVSIDSTNSPVVEGDTLSVTATIENTGDLSDSQTVGLSVSGLGSDSSSVPLNGGASTQETFSVGTSSGDAGDYTATVSSDDDSASTGVRVDAPANFGVSIDSTNSPVVEGESLSVTATIENTGNVSDTQTVELSVSGLGSDSSSVTLAGSASTQETLTVGTSSGDVGDYTATVSSDDDSASTGVRVDAPANFGVSIDSTNSAVVEGDTLSVTATIENTGDLSDSQTVQLGVGSLGSDSSSVSLAGGESTQETFTADTGSGDAGNYTATVSSEDDTASADVTVLAEAGFTVSIAGTNAPVVEGETLSVDATIENTGEVEATQTITLDVGALGSNSTSVTLSGGESTTRSLSVATGSGDAGNYTAAVSSDDDLASAGVTVLADANFAVSIDSTNSAVVEGETLSVDATIENTGEVEATQTITLDVGALGINSTSVTLSGGESTTAPLSVATGSGDAGNYTAAVSSDDDLASAGVTVLADANFAVSIDATNAPVVEGETLSIDATIENTGEVEATQTITLDVGALGSNSTSVTLSGGESTTVPLSVATSSGDAGNYTVTVSSEDDTASADVTVNEPANFDVAITSVSSAVTAGETITVAYDVTNTGDAQDTQDIDFAVNGTTEGTDSGVTLNGSETFSGQFSYQTATGDTPAVSVAVSSQDDSVTETVSVNEPSGFDVTLTSVTSSVTAGETITVAYEVTNTGDVQDTQDIEFAVNGSPEDTETGVTLNGGETFSGQFTYTTAADDTPALNVAVSSQDDSASVTVAVNEPTNFDVTITSVDSAVTKGETITVAYEVTNTGDVQDTQDIEFAVNGSLEATEAGVTLNGSETFSGQFSYQTVTGETPAVSVTVSSQDDSASETVTVNEPAVFEVTLTSVTSSVTAGETVTVGYEVTNTGDVQDTQDIDFAVNGTTEDTDAGVTLNGSQTFSGQFTYTTAAGDTPAVSVTVSSNDDSAAETVAVNEPTAFEVTLTSVTSSVVEGETVTIAYEVTNTGDAQDTQDIEFAVNGTVEGTESGVTLNGSETVSGQFTYTTAAGDTPALNVAVSSQDDSASATVAVNEPVNFDVTVTSVDASVTAGETITVAYEVTNTGDVQDTQAIDFAVNGTVEDTEVGVTLNGSETFSGQFSYATVAGDTPAVSVTVSSQDDSAGATVTVNEPSGFDVTIADVEGAVIAGETITVAYEVTNTGDVQDTQSIEFAVNGTTEATESGVTLNGSETVSGQFSYATATDDTPAVSVAVSSTDDTANADVTVNEPANFDAAITSVSATVTEGETVTVAYNVTNTGDAQDTQDIDFAVNGTLEDTEASVTLNGSELFSGQFSYDTVAGDVPAVSVTVSSQDDSASETVTVNEPANFDVTVTSVDASVTAGETVTVTYEVTNTGDAQDTQSIEFAVNGTTEGTDADVTLNGSESFSGQFSYQTATGDTPAVSVTVSSQDDSVTETVTVNEPAGFDVTIADVDSAVTAGETITVAYEVVNTGDVQDTQDIEFAVNGTTENTEAGVTLNGSETFSGQFSYQTATGDTPAVSVTVSSQDDSVTETVTVNKPAGFDVTISSVNSSVTAGETVTVAYEVTNTGDVQDTQDIDFAVNGSLEDTEGGVTLNGSEIFSGQFTYATAADDTPAVSVTVSSQDDSVTETVPVNEPATFTVGIVETNTPVAGETLNVTAQVQNIGDVGDEQTVDLNAGALGTDTATVTLGGGASTNVTVSAGTDAGDVGEYTATVSSEDDSASANVTVLAQAEFAVDIVETNTPVEGEQLNVTASVVNTGDVEDTQTIDLDAGALGTDSTSVTLGGGSTANLTLSVATGAGDAGEYTATVSSEDDSASASVTVLAPAEFAVDIVETTTPVEGEQLNVTAEITNTGDVEDAQMIDLNVGALGSASTSVTLGGGAATNVTLSVGTDAGDAGEYTATVSSADTQDTAIVTVLAPAVFTVSIVETTTPVEGETLNVTAQVQNTGDIQDTRTIDLDAGALGTDSTSVTLGGGSTANLTLSVATGAGDAGEYTATVSSEDDSASANVTVLAPAEFAVDIVETTTPVEGEQLNVTASVGNTGDVGDSETISLDAGALGSDSTSVTLSGGASTNVTLSVGTSAGDAGEYTATVSSADDTASANVTVLAPAEFAVDIVETNTPVEGEQLNVTAEISNIGDVADSQVIELDVGALGSDSRAAAVVGGESLNVTLSVSTGVGDAGEYTATVSSADDTASANVTVLAPAGFTVDILETTTPVAGTQLNVTAEITNTGDVEDTQTIDLSADALGSDSTSVTLAGGVATNLTLSVGTDAGDAGEYTATVSSEDDSASANVTVLAPAELTVDILETNTPVAGEQLNLTAGVQNTGDIGGTRTVTLDVGALGSSSTSVTLAGGASTTVTLSLDTTDGDAGNYTANVSTADDTDSASVTVLAPAEFTVGIDATSSPVVAGETLSVETTVENTGDVEATQTVTLDAGALGADSAQVTLAGGETTVVILSVTTSGGDAGTYTAVVESDDDTETESVTVLAQAEFGITVVETGAPVEGENLTVTAAVENTGDVEATQTVTLDAGALGADSAQVTLGGGESTNRTLSVGTEGGDAGEYTVTVASANDTDSATVPVLVPPVPALSNLTVAGDGNESLVLRGAAENVTANVTNQGEVNGEFEVTLIVSGEETVEVTRTVTVEPGETVPVRFENATGDLSPGSYDVTVSAGNTSVTGEVTLSVSVGDDLDPATDTDDDGLLEDTDGDGEFTIFDVQTFFVEFQSEPVQTVPALFNFDESGDSAVTIFDVQALFAELLVQNG